VEGRPLESLVSPHSNPTSLRIEVVGFEFNHLFCQEACEDDENDHGIEAVSRPGVRPAREMIQHALDVVIGERWDSIASE
jgi:hypothetical protein